MPLVLGDPYVVVQYSTHLNYLSGQEVSPQPGNYSQAMWTAADVDFAIHALGLWWKF